jgi:hypothetical protein
MTDFRERLGDPDLSRFYDYWTSLRGDLAMPSRQDVDPCISRPSSCRI